MAKQTKQEETRYMRVKRILNDASPKEGSEYMGYQKFWELPLEQFQQVSIFGIRMIAEPDTSEPPPVPAAPRSSCCHASADTPVNKGEQLPWVGRGESSGLVKGLRGQFPFDGKRFPRLPWGGEAVAPQDIDFIQQWIDDDCPADEPISSIPLTPIEDNPPAITAAQDKYTLLSMPATDGQVQDSGLSQRMNLDFLNPAQLERLRFAFRELYNLNKFPNDRRNYNNLALIHQNHCQHAWERFLPWHRIYLYEFEQALQDVCPGITLPYWDWTLPRYKDGAPDGDIIPNSFKAFLTEKSINDLIKHCHKVCKPKEDCAAYFELLRPLVGSLYVSQREFFAAVRKLWAEAGLPAAALVAKYRTWFIYVLLESNSLWYPLRYPAEYQDAEGKPTTINDAIHYHYPSLYDVVQIQSLTNFRDYGGGNKYNNSYGWIDQNPHNTIHIWSGGMNPDYQKPELAPGQKIPAKGVQINGRRYHKREDLYGQPQYGDMFSNLTASFDPIFWPHHVNVDRLWSEWQVNNPLSEPADPTAALTPWNYTIRDTYDIARFGYEYVRSTCIFPVGLGEAVTRLCTGAAGLKPGLLKQSKTVELRLHRVPQLPLSCYIRIYLNQPDANASTPWRDNYHFAGYVPIFGHGDCYGGPGHCDIPPDQPRKFDLRDRSHNTPRNHRINITACVHKLAEAGAKDLQVTLVVVGVDGRAIEGLFKLDSVSLNFKD